MSILVPSAFHRVGHSIKTAAPGPFTGCPNGRGRHGIVEASQVPGEPFRRAMLFDPGETHETCITPQEVLPSASNKASALASQLYRGSITRPALWLSTLHLADRSTRRKTRFRLVASLTGWVSHPRGSKVGFNMKLVHNPPTPSFTWRTKLS